MRTIFNRQEDYLMPRYPDVSIRLSGEDGNIFSIIGRVRGALRKAGHPVSVQDEFSGAVTATASYGEALRTVMAWVNVI